MSSGAGGLVPRFSGKAEGEKEVVGATLRGRPGAGGKLISVGGLSRARSWREKEEECFKVLTDKAKNNY